ncbi:MAG TPA: ribosome recycling factor [Nevskiaceae bacterium]|nr:ribosome recycling factor [Nevskiaceae bacterium]
MIEDIIKDASVRMQKCVDSLQGSFMKLRTGRASVGLVDHLRIDYYGSETPLSQVASVVAEDVRTLSITPWDKSMVHPIEKAIFGSDLGLTPNTAGTTIRINIPPLTEERRRDLIKVVKADTEQARVAIRGVRRDANQDLKDLIKEKLITADDEKRGTQEVQKLTDHFIELADAAMAGKEREMMVI